MLALFIQWSVLPILLTFHLNGWKTKEWKKSTNYGLPRVTYGNLSPHTPIYPWYLFSYFSAKNSIMCSYAMFSAKTSPHASPDSYALYVSLCSNAPCLLCPNYVSKNSQFKWQYRVSMLLSDWLILPAAANQKCCVENLNLCKSLIFFSTRP